MKLKESRKKANQKWDNENKERLLYLKKRSAAKNFISNHATLEDVENIKNWVEEREKNLG